MTTTATDTMDARIDARIKELQHLMDDVPDLRDAPTDREKSRVMAEAMHVRDRWGRLQGDKRALAETRMRIADNQPWCDDLEQAQGELQQQLKALEDVSHPLRDDGYYRKLEQTKDALRQLRVGPEWIGSMCMIAPPLTDFLAAKGYRGNPFNGRRSLLSVMAHLATLRRALGVVTAAIENELAMPLPPPIRFGVLVVAPPEK